MKRENAPMFRSGDLRFLCLLLVFGCVFLAAVDVFSDSSEYSNDILVTKKCETPDPSPASRDIPAADSSALHLSIDLNTAELGELMLLPGIGPRLAERIIEERQRSGPFEKIEDLLRIQGIGPKKLEAVRPFVRISPETNAR